MFYKLFSYKKDLSLLTACIYFVYFEFLVTASSYYCQLIFVSRYKFFSKKPSSLPSTKSFLIFGRILVLKVS